jgi:hypothetical protein
MNHVLRTILTVLVVLPAYVTLRVLWKARVPRNQVYTPFDRCSPNVPPRLVADLEAASARLAEAGFRARGWITHRRSPVLRSIAVLHESADATTTVTLLAAVRDGSTMHGGMLANCVSEMDDGTLVATSNAPYPMPMRAAGNRMVQLPGVMDPVELAAIHGRIVAADRTAPRPRPVGGDAAAFFSERVNAQNAQQVRAGTLAPAKQAGTYRYTLAGALYAAFASTPPYAQVWKLWTRMKDRRLAARV